MAPGSQFRLFRSRVIGGRTNHYARVQLRYSDYDFKNRSMRGVGFDWPISYQDLAPYYDKAERLIGVTGKAEGLRSAPDGIFQKPAPFKTHEVLVERACAKLGIKATSARQAVITSPLNGRPACHYCGQCGRGCGAASNYASSYVQIFPAMKTGNVTVLTNSMARELITDSTGKVTAVSYIDKGTRAERQVRCRTVVLSAASCESARLLLNSKSPRHPNGVANSHGMVGKPDRLCRIRLVATVPYLRGADSQHRQYGALVYPWWGAEQRQADFRRYRRRFMAAASALSRIWCTGLRAERRGGLPMKAAIREAYGGVPVSLAAASCANEDCCDIDPEVKDMVYWCCACWKWSTAGSTKGGTCAKFSRHL